MSNSSINGNGSSSMNQVTYSGSSVLAIPMAARMWMFFASNIMSVICGVFVLYHLLTDANLRRALNNHVVIIIIAVNLIEELTCIPWLLYRMRFEIVLIQLPFFCQLWQVIDSITYTGIPKLVAWASIERHILIFHGSVFLTFKNRVLFHYSPIGILSAYHVLFYVVIYFIYPCDNVYDYTKSFCGYDSCAYDTSYGIYELFTNGVLSSLCIAVGSIALIYRVIRQRYRVHRYVDWRKHRKLTIQLMAIVSIFYIFYLPLVLLALIRYFTIYKSFASQYYVYASFLSYYINYLLPLVCIGSLSHIKFRMKNALFFWKKKARNVAALTTFQSIKTTARTATGNVRWFKSIK